jgi:uncharacterized protein YcsI (UPF0317 family)
MFCSPAAGSSAVFLQKNGTLIVLKKDVVQNMTSFFFQDNKSVVLLEKTAKLPAAGVLEGSNNCELF